MKKVEQDYIKSFSVTQISTGTRSHLILSHGFGDELEIDNLGAANLIKVLQEFIDGEPK